MGRRLSGAGTVALMMITLVVVSLTTVSPGSAAASSALRTTSDAVTRTLAGRGRVVVAARAVPCRGFPSMRIIVNGRLDRTVKVGSRVATRYVSERTYALARHRVRLVMVDDHRTATCDRTVAVERVRLTEPMPVPAPGDADRGFTLAVIGDTQDEVVNRADTAFARTTAWLAARKSAQDIRFVAHTGDITNWGWLAPAQLATADAAMARLTEAGIPWQVSIGNHDTRVVGVGGEAYVDSGSACVTRFGEQECHSRILLRRTQEFNEVFTPADYAGSRGSWPAGRTDNTFSTFEAAGRKWLLLNLELWPRRDAVRWAAAVITSHPRSNVIVQTHDYLTQRGRVRGTNGGYGATSPRFVESRLIAPYGNVKMVLSGHEGRAATRVFRYANGHRVVAFLGNQTTHYAVLRLVHVDVARGVVASKFWTGTPEPRLGSGRLTYASGLRFR